ncbi:hypothetical protein HDU82_004346 [Entophlyctis luteolus]|nr:hypothetical protein HDU82_004346 [Entophlyctis luteolus]
MDFVTAMFPQIPPDEIASIISRTPEDLSEVDVEVAVEAVLASLAELDAIDTMETPWPSGQSVMRESSSMAEDYSDSVAILATVFSDVRSDIIAKVLAVQNGDVAAAGDQLSMLGNNAIKAVMEEERIAVNANLAVGREHDLLTVRDMFPTLSIGEIRQLLATHGGLHRTIDFLTGADINTANQFRDGVHQAPMTKANVIYSKAVKSPLDQTNASDLLASAQNTVRFSRASNVSHLDSRSTESDASTVANKEGSFEVPATNPDYCRQKAAEHRQKRAEAFQAAAKEYKKGSMVGRGSAQYFSEVGHFHSSQVDLWNARAAKLIIAEHRQRQNQSFTLDLHGLTRHEALEELQRKLSEHFDGRKKPLTPLEVVTGAGRRSPGRKAVLLPAVIGFLKHGGWKYSYDGLENSGVIFVTGRE